MGQYDALLQPFTLRHLTLRNRIVSTSHAPAYAEGGMPQGALSALSRREGQGRHRPHHVRRLVGRLARMPRDLRPARRQRRPHHARISASSPTAIHGLGAALMCQISHMGRRTRWDAGDWLAPVAPSRGARAGAPLLPQGDGGLGLRPHHPRFRPGGAALQGGRARRRRALLPDPASGARSSGRPAPTSAPTSMAAASTTACASA